MKDHNTKFFHAATLFRRKKQEITKTLEKEEQICRPANFPAEAPGRDHAVAKARDGTVVATFCLLGRTYMRPVDCPYHAADRVLKELAGRAACVIVDMHAPGVDVRPLRQITGEAEFNEIFLSGVEVPLENVIGDVGGGWDVAMTTLLHERGTLGFALVARLEVQVKKLVALVADRGATATQREAVAREWSQLQALRWTAYRSLSALERTGLPGPEGSILKLQWSEANQRVTKLALELLGPDAQLLPGNAPYDGYWTIQQLRCRGNTIEAGTSEILRNIVAERVLGLPRSR